MTKRKTDGPRINPTEFKSIAQIDLGIKKFTRLRGKVSALDASKIHYNDQEVHTLETDFHDLLADVYGVDSVRFQKLQHPSIWAGGYNTGDSEYVKQDKFAEGIRQTVKKIEGLITHLTEEKEDFISPTPEPLEPERPTSLRSTVNIQGDVGRLALRDFNEQNITAVAMLNLMADAIQEAKDIPEPDKKSLVEKLRALAENPYVVSLGSQAIIELLRGLG